MNFWSEFFLEIEVIEKRTVSNRSLDAIARDLITALDKSHLKISTTIHIGDKEYSASRYPAFFGSGSTFDGDLFLSPNGVACLCGEISLWPLFRLYFQAGTIVAVCGSLLVSGIAGFRWLWSGGVQDLEVTGAGIAVAIVFPLFVRGIATLNYISTREEKKKISYAFQTL